jgi:hypothetical protein
LGQKIGRVIAERAGFVKDHRESWKVHCVNKRFYNGKVSANITNSPQITEGVRCAVWDAGKITTSKVPMRSEEISSTRRS